MLCDECQKKKIPRIIGEPKKHCYGQKQSGKQCGAKIFLQGGHFCPQCSQTLGRCEVCMKKKKRGFLDWLLKR